MEPARTWRAGRRVVLPILLLALAFVGYRVLGNWLSVPRLGIADAAVYVPAQDFGFRVTTWSPVCAPGVFLPDDRELVACRLSKGDGLIGVVLLRRLPVDVEEAVEASFPSFARQCAQGRSYAVIGTRARKVRLGTAGVTVWHRRLWVVSSIRYLTVIFWPDRTGSVVKLVTFVLCARREGVPIEGTELDRFLAGVEVPGAGS